MGKELIERLIAADASGVLEQLPTWLRLLAVLERFYLYKPEFFQNVTRDPSFTPYLPQHSGVFRLPCLRVPRRHLHIYRQAECLESFAGESLLFPIHPSAVADYASLSSLATQDDAEIWAVPTASSRTLLAWPDQHPERALFIKTSLFSRIFGDRRLRRDRIARNIGLSTLTSLPPGLPSGCNVFSERLALVPRGEPDAGVIIRPLPPKPERQLLLPLFALIGGIGDRTPLLLLMIQHGIVDAEAFVRDVLCEQMARLWLYLTMQLGLIIEPHAQNLLVVVSEDLVPQCGGFFYRDLEGLRVDWQLRRSFNLPECAVMPGAWQWRRCYSNPDFPYHELVAYQWTLSLTGYLRFFLQELQLSLESWSQRGLIPPPRFPSTLTLMFSRCLREAIRRTYSVQLDDYDIANSLTRFVIELHAIRSSALRKEW